MASKHETISDVLIEEILSGQYRMGERLPSERDLAQRFDANRGAVREAMKRLEQLGLANVQPGGARVNPIQQASLDVVGYMMARGDLPDAGLVDQVLTVINALIKTAAETAVVNADEAGIEGLRALVQPLIGQDLTTEAHEEARVALIRGIMLTSGNLVLQLIARTLFEQFGPSMEPLRPFTKHELDLDAYTTYARQLDQALSKRDIPAVRATFEAFAQLNRETIMRAFVAADRSQHSREVAAS
ncbi:MAG: FadR/GntR family transcriptional regulator [Pseudomonadales bacterium]